MIKSLEKEFKNLTNKLIIVSDFDYTLTEYGGLITHQAFDPEKRIKFKGKEGTLQFFVLHDWWSESHQILIQSQLGPKDIANSPQFIKWRDGAKELLQLCEASSVPFVIISAGIYDVIEQMIQDLLGKIPKNLTIIANKMNFENEKVVSFGPIIHSLNKKPFLRETLSSTSQTKILLLGDCEDDLLDPSFPEKQFSISLNPQRETRGFDLQLKIKDLQPVIEIVKEHIC